MQIHVTQQDIEVGLGLSDKFCPIGIAVRRITDTDNVRVAAFVYVNGVPYSMPQVAHQFIEDFDNGKPVAPFTFELGSYAELV